MRASFLIGMARMTGLEPATTRSTVWYANQLRHIPALGAESIRPTLESGQAPGAWVFASSHKTSISSKLASARALPRFRSR